MHCNRNNIILFFLLVPGLSYTCACSPEKDVISADNTTEESTNDEGTKRLWIRTCTSDRDDVFFPKDLSSRTIVVNGESIAPLWDENRNVWYVDARHSSFDSYSAEMVSESSDFWYDTTPVSVISIPSVQFLHKTDDLRAIPLIAEYDPSLGSFLDFCSPCAVLVFNISGMDNLVSLVLSADQPLSGKAKWSRAERKFFFSGTSGEVVLNCSATASCKQFPVLVFGRDLTNAVLKVCTSSHEMKEFQLGDIELECGTVYEKNLSFDPDKTVIWYEGFDRCVWGGDSAGGKAGVAPDTLVPSTDGDKNLSGYEYSLASVPASTPGSGFLQKSFASQQLPLSKMHQMSDSYIQSRGFFDYRYMLRCRECPGYISVGCGDSKRGWFAMYPLKDKLNTVKNLEISFRLCLEQSTTDDILFLVQGSESVITRWWLDEVEGSLSSLSQRGTSDTLRLSPGLVGKGAWKNVRLLVDNCTDLTSLHWQGASSEDGNHGFYLDEILVREVPGGWDKRNKLRLLYWNIQNGMWGDQGNNYDNFVAFVNKYDPDVCVWCEARTNHETGSDKVISTSPYLPDHWRDLAARYGHSYSAKAQVDKFPQAVTSRYPVSLVKQLGEPLKHGAGIFKISTPSGDIYPLVLHLSPNLNGISMETARLTEMKYIISSSVNMPSLGIDHWILLGDFNATSRFDKRFYSSDEGYMVHDHIASNTSLTDLFAARYPGSFLYTSGGKQRLDYIYMDEATYKRVADACVLTEEWTSPVGSGISTFYYPSDHRPLLVDFNI